MKPWIPLLLLVSLAACDSDSCLKETETGEVADMIMVTVPSCGRYGCTDIQQSVIKIKRDDGTVCVVRSWNDPTPMVEKGDRIRGPR